MIQEKKFKKLKKKPTTTTKTRKQNYKTKKKNTKIKPKQTGKKQTCMHQTKVYTFTGISNPSKHEVIASMYI